MPQDVYNQVAAQEKSCLLMQGTLQSTEGRYQWDQALEQMLRLEILLNLITFSDTDGKQNY
jgi:hypothetical protein